jgi:Ser/Thr protein kinase RdoA (MazF antagonist)
MQHNAHRRFLNREELQDILRRAGIDSPVIEYSLLDGGTFNSVYRISVAGRPGLILKLSPDPLGPMMTYETGILDTEAQFYTLARERAGLPVPEVIETLYLGTEFGGGQALLVTELPGVPWAGSGLPAAARGAVRAELGQLMAAMHAVTGPAFGYPSESTGTLSLRWDEAFTAMINAVLSDAERYQAVLPVEPQRVRNALLSCANELAAVQVPALVHFDLWEGNILLDLAGHPRISGLVDGERAMWGDPVMDFASAALFGEIRDDEDFIGGYQLSGTVLPLDSAGRRRLLLYRVYLWLIMTVEPIPRGYGQARSTHAETVAERLTADLSELEHLA